SRRRTLHGLVLRRRARVARRRFAEVWPLRAPVGWRAGVALDRVVALRLAVEQPEPDHHLDRRRPGTGRGSKLLPTTEPAPAPRGRPFPPTGRGSRSSS